MYICKLKLNIIVLQSAKNNVLDTLKDSLLTTIVEDSVLEDVAESIVKNLCIEHDKFPKL